MTFKMILCPTDFSRGARAALNKAVELAADSDAEICVLHVDEPAPSAWANDTGASGSADAPGRLGATGEAARRADAVAKLCALVAEGVPPTVRVRPFLMAGSPAEQIIRAAREEGADLIVLPPRGAGEAGAEAGESGTGRVGRVAQEVLRRANCPVLLYVEPAGGQPAAGQPSPAEPFANDQSANDQSANDQSADDQSADGPGAAAAGVTGRVRATAAPNPLPATGTHG